MKDYDEWMKDKRLGWMIKDFGEWMKGKRLWWMNEG